MTFETGYTAGDWVGVTDGGMWLLAEAAPGEPVVLRCWELIRAGAEQDRILSALLLAGLRAVGGFALVRHASGRTEVVVRGQGRVELVTAAGDTVSVSVDQAGECADRTLDEPVVEVRLSGPVTPPEDTAVLPIAGGVVLAADLLGTRLTTPVGLPPAATPAVYIEPAVSAPNAVPFPTPPATPEGGESTSQFERVFEKTALPKREEEFPPETYAPLPQSPQTPKPQRRMENTGLIDDVSSWAGLGVSARPAEPRPMAQPAFQPAPQQSANGPGDLEMTIHKGRQPAAGAESNGAGPMVSAIRCQDGHPNPVTAQRCRFCGAAMSGDGPTTIKRPPLGVLRLPDGEVIRLDRGVILGRAPGAPDGERDGRNRVRLSSPDNSISREHAEVRLDGWQVLLVDLGSANGTAVTMPSGASEVLPQGGSRVLEPGSVITLADTVSLRFEVTG